MTVQFSALLFDIKWDFNSQVYFFLQGALTIRWKKFFYYNHGPIFGALFNLMLPFMKQKVRDRVSIRVSLYLCACKCTSLYECVCVCTCVCVCLSVCLSVSLSECLVCLPVCFLPSRVPARAHSHRTKGVRGGGSESEKDQRSSERDQKENQRKCSSLSVWMGLKCSLSSKIIFNKLFKTKFSELSCPIKWSSEKLNCVFFLFRS